jgi:hypothetical protein
VKILLVANLLLLGGCALFQTQNPPQEAYAINKEYQAVATVELGVLQNVSIPATVKCAIKAGDNVAFGYVTQTTVQAKAWNDASSDNKPAELTAFNKLMILARSALDNLTSIINLVQKGGTVSCPSQ